MKGQSKWDYQPYFPIDQLHRREYPCITRIVPRENSIQLYWSDSAKSRLYVVFYREYHSESEWTTYKCKGTSTVIPNLTPNQDYEFYIRPSDNLRSDSASLIRIATCGPTVGTVVNYLHKADLTYAFSGRYLCSPSLVKLPHGTLLASMDVYEKESPQNLTKIFHSQDRGRTWDFVTDLFPCFWGKLFVHRKELYMLGFTTEYGNLIIGKSYDNGKTWSAPVTLFPGSGMWKENGPHRAPTAIIEHENRLWASLDYGCWVKGGHASGVISIDASLDLLVAENWVCSKFTPYNPQWKGAVCGPSYGALEGNIICGPSGDLYNILRYQMTGCSVDYGKAIMLSIQVSDPEAPLSFHKIIDFNGGSNAKFSIVFDDVSKTYLAIVNEVVQQEFPAQRNVLSLAFSYDLEKWRIVKRLIDYRDKHWMEVGFQYVDFLIDKDDILFLCRTAMLGADNYHNSNMITFHSIENFRMYLQ